MILNSSNTFWGAEDWVMSVVMFAVEITVIGLLLGCATPGRTVVGTLCRVFGAAATAIGVYGGIGFYIMFGSWPWPVESGDDLLSSTMVVDAGIWKVDLWYQCVFAAWVSVIMVCGHHGRNSRLTELMSWLIVPALVYPVVGGWKWGGGWLELAGFYDFAGGTLIYCLGGCVGLGLLLAGALNGKRGVMESEAVPGTRVLTALSMSTWMALYLFNFARGLIADLRGEIEPNSLRVVFSVSIVIGIGAGVGFLISMLDSHRMQIRLFVCGCIAALASVASGVDQMTITESGVTAAIAAVLTCVGIVLIDRINMMRAGWFAMACVIGGAVGTLATALVIDPQMLMSDGSSQNPWLAQAMGVGAIGGMGFLSALMIGLIGNLVVHRRAADDHPVS